MFHRVLAASLRLAGLAGTAVAFAAAAQAADNIRYVSTAGSNANNCKLATPCRSLQRGINRTPVGGELRILDSGDYGANGNIQKSLTISGNGHTIFVGNGIVIDNADAVVVLRRLALDGQGTVGEGINIDAATAVHIEHCVIRNFTSGILAGAANAAVFILDSISRDNKAAGLFFFNVVGTIDNSRFENNGVFGIQVSGGRTTIHRSTVSANGGDGVVVTTNGTQLGILSTVSAQNGGSGFRATTGAGMTVDSSMALGNADAGLDVSSTGNSSARISLSTFIGNGIGIDNGGTVETRGNSTVRSNTTDFAGNALTPIGGD